MTSDPLTARLAEDLDGAFPDAVEAVAGGVYSGALRMLGDHHEAEDITQEALIRAYRALGGYPPERIRALRLRAWVWTIAANLCRNRLRSRARKPTAALGRIDPAERDPGPEAAAVATDSLGRLSRLLLELPWEMRSAVVLRHVLDLTYAEISAALERPEATVRSDVHRGLARLRDLYELETR